MQPRGGAGHQMLDGAAEDRGRGRCPHRSGVAVRQRDRDGAGLADIAAELITSFPTHAPTFEPAAHLATSRRPLAPPSHLCATPAPSEPSELPGDLSWAHRTRAVKHPPRVATRLHCSGGERAVGRADVSGARLHPSPSGGRHPPRGAGRARKVLVAPLSLRLSRDDGRVGDGVRPSTSPRARGAAAQVRRGERGGGGVQRGLRQSRDVHAGVLRELRSVSVGVPRGGRRRASSRADRASRGPASMRLGAAASGRLRGLLPDVGPTDGRGGAAGARRWPNAALRALLRRPGRDRGQSDPLRRLRERARGSGARASPGDREADDSRGVLRGGGPTTVPTRRSTTATSR